jgi:hypothetical protein
VTYPVTLDFSKAQPLPQASGGVMLDFSKAQPLPAADDRNSIQKSFDANTKTDPKEPLLETGLKSVVGAVGAPFVHPLDTLNSLGNLINPDTSKNPILNAVQSVGADYKAGGAGYAATKLAGNTVGGVALGGAAGAVADVLPEAASAVKGGTSTALAKAQKVLGNAPVSGQSYTPTHAAAFEGAIAPATAMGKNFIPQNVTPEALTPIRTTAANMAQGTPVQQGIVKAATASSTPPMERLGAYQAIVQQSLNDLEAQHAPALAQAASVPVDTSGIVNQLQSHISATMAPADVSAVNQLIDRVKQAKTIGDLNTFRQELNTSTSPEYRMSQVQAGRTGVSAQAESDLAGWVRNAYYDNLQKATGTDFAPLKRQEANLITTQEALQNQQAPLAKAEAQFAAPTTWRTKAGNLANVVKDPKTTVTQNVLRESPATGVSTLLQKSLADLPAPTTAAAQTPSINLPQPSTLPQLGRGQPPILNGTPVTPAPPPASLPPPSPSGLPAPPPPPPQPTLAAPPQRAALPGTAPLQLPASTAGYTPTPPSPPPPFNPATARMRVQPTQFSPQPTPAAPSGPIPVTPEGQAVTGAMQRYAPPAATAPPTAATTPALKGQALWASKGAAKLAQQLQQAPIAGVSAADLDALAKTTQGKKLLVIASDLNPGSPAMRNLVQQIKSTLGATR